MDKDLKVIGQEKYLGLNCTVVRTSVRSNTIEIWYTNDIAFRGTPQPNMGVPNGLVLRVVRNGDTVQEATGITPVKEEQSLLPSSWGTKMIAEVYQYKINHSNVITIPVFEEENVCFNGAKFPEKLEGAVSYSVGGGTIFGPQPRDYDFKLNRKVKQLARKSALSLRAKQNELLVLDTLAFDAPKTKAMVEVLNNLQVAGKKVLFIVDDANINARKSAANIQRVNVVNVNELNTYTIMNSNAIVFTESSVATLEATLK